MFIAWLEAVREGRPFQRRYEHNTPEQTGIKRKEEEKIINKTTSNLTWTAKHAKDHGTCTCTYVHVCPHMYKRVRAKYVYIVKVENYIDYINRIASPDKITTDIKIHCTRAHVFIWAYAPLHTNIRTFTRTHLDVCIPCVRI